LQGTEQFGAQRQFFFDDGLILIHDSRLSFCRCRCGGRRQCLSSQRRQQHIWYTRINAASYAVARRERSMGTWQRAESRFVCSRSHAEWLGSMQVESSCQYQGIDGTIQKEGKWICCFRIPCSWQRTSESVR